MGSAVPDEARLNGSHGSRPTALTDETSQALAAAAQTRNAINLRLLLELRRRVKATAQRELAAGADRLRMLRNDLHRSETELWLFSAALKTRSQELAKSITRLQNSQARASQTCSRLSSLEREQEDLCLQLDSAAREAAGLRESVRATHPTRNCTLDSLVLATEGLVNELAQAARDQAELRARGQDVVQEGEALASRARALQLCFSSLGKAVAALCDDIDGVLDGLPTRRPSAPPASQPAGWSG